MDNTVISMKFSSEYRAAFHIFDFLDLLNQLAPFLKRSYQHFGYCIGEQSLVRYAEPGYKNAAFV